MRTKAPLTRNMDAHLAPPGHGIASVRLSVWRVPFRCTGKREEKLGLNQTFDVQDFLHNSNTGGARTTVQNPIYSATQPHPTVVLKLIFAPKNEIVDGVRRGSFNAIADYRVPRKLASSKLGEFEEV